MTSTIVAEALGQTLGRFRVPEVVRFDKALYFKTAEFGRFIKELWGRHDNRVPTTLRQVI